MQKGAYKGSDELNIEFIHSNSGPSVVERNPRLLPSFFFHFLSINWFRSGF